MWNINGYVNKKLKVNKHRFTCGAINKTLKNKTRKNTRLKFCESTAVPITM